MTVQKTPWIESNFKAKPLIAIWGTGLVGLAVSGGFAPRRRRGSGGRALRASRELVGGHGSARGSPWLPGHAHMSTATSAVSGGGTPAVFHIGRGALVVEEEEAEAVVVLAERGSAWMGRNSGSHGDPGAQPWPWPACSRPCGGERRKARGSG